MNDDSRLIKEAFDTYYSKGTKAYNEGNLDVASRNLLEAAHCLSLLAKQTKDQNLKSQRLSQAEELCNLVEQMEIKKALNPAKANKPNNPIEQKTKSVEKEPVKVIKTEAVSLEEALKELDDLIGLKSVKEKIRSVSAVVQVNKARTEQGLKTTKTSNHMVFVGNPGTGKTTVARIIGKIYRALGVLSSGHVIETDRSSLVKGYVGHSEEAVKEIFKQAMGGVLFIDEAYALANGGENDFGKQVIDILNKMMEDYRDDVIVIVAGYEKEMEKFLKSNPGLSSRFSNYIRFPDYTGEEKLQIFQNMLHKYQYVLSEPALNAIRAFFNNPDYYHLEKYEVERYVEANGRGVRNFYETCIELQSTRVIGIKEKSKEDLMTITISDLPFLK